MKSVVENEDYAAHLSMTAARSIALVPAGRTGALPALELVRVASGKIRKYEDAFSQISRDVSVAISSARSENTALRATIAETETSHDQTISMLHASHHHCRALTRRMRELEEDLFAAEQHIRKSSGYIARLAAYIKTHMSAAEAEKPGSHCTALPHARCARRRTAPPEPERMNSIVASGFTACSSPRRMRAKLVVSLQS